MSRETGLAEAKVKALVKRLESVHNVIRYDSTTKEVLVLNWWKYNWSKSADLLNGVRKVANYIKNSSFRDYVLNLVESRPSGDPPHTVPSPSVDPVGTSVSVSVSDSDTVSDPDTASDREYTDDFEIFWQVYPKKVGKKEAYKAFRRANKPVQLLVHAVQEQEQSEQWLKEDGRYIPNPTTWLNQGRWEDTLPKRKVGERNSEGFYTLSNGMQTSNPFLAMIDKEENNDEGTDSADFVYVESGISSGL